MLLLLVLPVIRKVEHVIIPTVRGICFLVAVSSRRAQSLLILMEIPWLSVLLELLLLPSATCIVLPPIIVSMSYSHDNHNLLLLYVKNVTATGATGNSERGTCKSFNCARYLFFLSPCLRGVRASETRQN